ncbi:MAG: DNA recombination protein RmuC [Clostridia bacterium]
MLDVTYVYPILLGGLGLGLILIFVIISKLNKFYNDVKRTAESNEIVKTQIDEMNRFLDKQMSILEKEIHNQNDRQTMKIEAELERSVSVIREQVSKDIGIQNEVVATKLGEFQNNLTERFGKLELGLGEKFSNLAGRLNKDLVDNKDNIADNMTGFRKDLILEMDNNFTSLKSEIDKHLSSISDKVDERLMEGFKQTNETFSNILARLSKIDEAQKNIESLSSDIISLQDVLTDKKTRGTFGEVQLSQLLAAVFGDKNDGVYELQHKMPNNKISDAVIKTPEPLGLIAIDSKFPLENYRRMIDRELHEHQRAQASRDFKMNVKRHIDHIAERYIVPDYTSNQAIMFIPAEAVFAEIYAYHEDLVKYSQEKRVWIVSPTTLMSVLTTIQVVLQNMEREKFASIIHDELKKLGEEFKRYRRRWNKLRTHIDRVSDDVRNVHITTEKISSKFEQISNAEVETEEKKKLSE